MQLQQSNQSLRINKADTSKNVQINYKYVFNPHKTLGHYKAPAGTGKVQATVLAEQDKQYAYRITKSSLTHHEVWMYYTSCYQKSVGSDGNQTPSGYILGAQHYWQVNIGKL